MCRALVVMCVAEDREALAALKAASVAAEWELAAGATELRAALDQVDAERPHVMVAFGDQRELVRIVHDRFPAMRIVVDRDTPGATAVATSLEDVRGLVVGLPRPGGPVGP